MPYSKQSFSSGQAISYVHLNQLETNIAAHVHNAGTGSVSQILLSLMGTELLNASTAVGSGNLSYSVIQSGSASHRFYKYSIRGDASTDWANGTVGTTGPTIAGSCHSVIRRSETADDTLVLINGSTGSRTAYYRVFQINEEPA